MRRGVLLVLALLLASAAAVGQAEQEPPQKVRIVLATRPGSVDVYLLPAASGTVTWLGSSQEPLTLSLEPGQTEVVLLLQSTGYRPTVLRLPRAEVTEGARLGPVVLEPARGEGLQRLVRENLWLLLGMGGVLGLYLHSRRTLRRVSRAPAVQPPPSIGPVVYSAHPVQPADLPLRRRPDPIVLGCGGVAGVLVGLILWAGSHLAGSLWDTLPLSPDLIWKGFLLAFLASALMEIILAEPLLLAEFVGERGLARFQLHYGVQSELVLFQEIDRVEEQVLDKARGVVYRWLTPSGQVRLEIQDLQGVPGFAAAALAAWRQARGQESSSQEGARPGT